MFRRDKILAYMKLSVERTDITGTKHDLKRIYDEDDNILCINKLYDEAGDKEIFIRMEAIQEIAKRLYKVFKDIYRVENSDIL